MPEPPLEKTKAFLCHSSDDKPFVSEVAQRLGRARSTIDEQSFEPGTDFRSEIVRLLDEAGVFVFFATKQSLNSTWCAFELDQAQMRVLHGRLQHCLVLFIDGEVDASVLPDWLKSIRAVACSTPGEAELLIGKQLDKLPWAPNNPFLGRHKDLQRGARKLSVGSPVPKVLVATGLEGVGRRSYVQKLAKEALNLEIWPMVPLHSSATLEDLFIANLLAHRVLRQVQVEAEIDRFRALTDEQQVQEIVDGLETAAANGYMPCLVDQGAVLDSSGHYYDDFESLIREISLRRMAYLSIVHNRTPSIENNDLRRFVYIHQLRPLEPIDTRSLLSRLLREIEVDASEPDIQRLADAVAGYPPAAYFMVEQIELRGMDMVLRDEAVLADYQNRSFGRFLREIGLSETEKTVLRYLSQEDRLPIEAVATATGSAEGEVVSAISRLQDLNAVEALDDSYSIAGPLVYAVERNFGGFNRRWYEQAYERLSAHYWVADAAIPSLSVVDATLHAGLRIGTYGVQRFGKLVRPSVLVRAANDMYHEREYEIALEYAERALQIGRPTPQILEVKIKSLAQLRRWEPAKQALREYREFGERRAWYLDGFIERKRGNHNEACKKFQQGYSLGDKSTALLRDYAESLYRIGYDSRARDLVNEAVAREPGNVFLRDLKARIELAFGTIPEAEAAVEELRTVDLNERFYPVRRAEFLLGRQGNAEALKAAKALLGPKCDERNAPFDFLVVYARVLLRLRDWDGYKAAKDRIRDQLRSRPKTILQRLDCDAALQRSDWRDAEKILATSTGDWTNAAKLQVAQLKSEDGTLLPTERDEASETLSDLESKAKDSHEDYLDPAWID